MTCVHLTETCDAGQPRLITHVQTSRAGNGDVDITPLIHQALQQKALLPTDHLTATNYAEAKQFLQSQRDDGIDLIAPTRADHKWPAQQRQGFDANSFVIDWPTHKATCPAGHTSLSWTPAIDRRDNQVIQSTCSRKDGLPGALRPECTKAKRRAITLRARVTASGPAAGQSTTKRACLLASLSLACWRARNDLAGGARL